MKVSLSSSKIDESKHFTCKNELEINLSHNPASRKLYIKWADKKKKWADGKLELNRCGGKSLLIFQIMILTSYGLADKMYIESPPQNLKLMI